MIIGIDAGALSISDDRLKVGVYRVVKNALEALAAIDKKNNYRLYTFQAIEQGIVDKFDGRAQVVQLPKLGWQRAWLPLELKRHPVDAYLGFAQALPSVKTLCDLGFIYDLGFLYEPDAYGGSAAVLKKQTDDLVRRATHIITISEATKLDIIDKYSKTSFRRSKPGSRASLHYLAKLSFPLITVAYPGVDARFSPAGPTHTGPRPYFLFVGSLTKTKDIPALIAAFAGFCQNNKLYDLLLIGGDYWPDPEIDRAIDKYGLENRVKRIGFISDKELPSYYRGATAYVTAALREGFCLPAVEAMACGTPVVGLDRGALREVVGDGGMIVRKKEKVKSLRQRRISLWLKKSNLVEAMMEMTNGNTRKYYAKKAIEQAKKFRWEKFGNELLHLLDDYSRKNLG